MGGIPGRMQVIREYRQQGGSIAAVFPIHYPRALLRAFDILPVEVWGPPRVTAGHAAEHLQPYVCSIVHNAVSFLQSGGLDVVDLLLVPHACDSLQGLGSLLIDFLSPHQSVITLYIPRNGQQSGVDFLADELRAIYLRLQEITGRSPSHDDLLDATRREEVADGLLAELHHQRCNLAASDEEFYFLLRSREFIPAERFTPLAKDMLSKTGRSPRIGVPILLSGILPEPMSLFAALTEMGYCVVADDLACCGRRLYPGGLSDEPFQRMAERIIYAPPDSTRASPIQARLEHLVQLAKTSAARGVIFYSLKFCEPELFDLPQLRQGLQESGLPSLLIEVDLNELLSQPVLTRLAAFLEMLA